MIKILKEVKNPLVLVITPLKLGNKISKETKLSIERNKFDFTWISFESNQNRPKNILNALNNFKKPLPKYILPIDDNVKISRNYIRDLYLEISNSKDEIGYVYGNLKYIGEITQEFPAKAFNLGKLLQSNYISSNSMFKTKYILKYGLITDDKFIRLEDWAFLIKLATNGIYGKPVNKVNHEAKLNKNNTSTKGQDDYNKKAKLVFDEFIYPFLMEIRKQQIEEKNESENNNFNILE